MIIPQISVKNFSDTTPGELIRMSLRGKPLLALVAEHVVPPGQTQKLLIFLEWPFEKGEAPLWYPSKHDLVVVQSFGSNTYEFVIPIESGAVDFSRSGSAIAGCLEVRESGKYLVAPPYPELFGVGYAFYNIQTGVVEGPPPYDAKRMFATKWAIKLSAYNPPHPLAAPLVSFDVGSRS